MRVALLGCGFIGSVHAPMLTKAGFKLAVCADQVSAKAERLAQQYGADTTTDAYEAIERDDVDVVCVATPTPIHKDLVVAAARAGKHILCEKPFTRTVDEAEEAAAEVEKAGVKLFPGHVVRYYQEFETIRKQIATGSVGNPGFIKLYRGGAAPVGEGNWYADYKQSGGVIFDLLIHDFDWVRYVCGSPKHVYANSLQRPDRMDYSHVTFRMTNSVIAHFIGSWAHPSGFRVKADVVGDGGRIFFDSAEAPVFSERRGQDDTAKGTLLPSSPVDVSPFQLEWEDFAAWLREEKTPRLSMEDAVWAVRMASAALESNRTGEPVLL